MQDHHAYQHKTSVIHYGFTRTKNITITSYKKKCITPFVQYICSVHLTVFDILTFKQSGFYFNFSTVFMKNMSIIRTEKANI
jgi:hypothetical protein